MSVSTDPSWQTARPRRRWLVALALLLAGALLIGAGLVAWSLTAEETYVAPTPERSQQASAELVDAGGAGAVLEDLARAMRSGDVDAAAALAPAGDADAAQWLTAVVRNAKALGLTDVSLRYLTDGGAPDRGGDWDAVVDTTWRIRRFDAHPATGEVTFHLHTRGDRVSITGVGGRDGVLPLWLQGPLEVRRTPDTLVAVAGPAARADRYAGYAARAVPVVRQVLPGWHRGLVVEVPASVDDLDRTLDADAGTYDQIAAVTTSVDGTLSASAPVHVFVNPDVFDRLQETGAQVVMSHEATHVASGAWDSSMPLWLLEGFADYVALRDVDLPVSAAASQVIAEVHKDGPPRALPTAADFGTRTPNLGATYESAWLACRLLAERAGEDALVRVYRSVDRDRPLGAALESAAGMSVRDLTRAWRAELSELAS